MKDAIREVPNDSVGRYIFKRRITGNLGRIIETEDQILVFIDKKKIPSQKKFCEIICSGISQRDKDKARKYGLEKPICYVFENLEFENQINIKGQKDCEIVIRNCKINKLFLDTNGKCNIRDRIIEYSNTAISGSISIYTKELFIKNTIICNKSNKSFEGITIRGDKILSLNNTIIDGKNCDVILYTFGPMDIYNSKIKSRLLKIASYKLGSTRRSCLEASRGVTIKSSISNEISIISPAIETSGSTFNNLTTPVILKRVPYKLRQKRLELLSQLNNLKNIAVTKYQEETSKLEQELSNRPVIKMLSKKS